MLRKWMCVAVLVLSHAALFVVGFNFRRASEYVEVSAMVDELKEDALYEERNYEIVIIVAMKKNIANKDVNWAGEIIGRNIVVLQNNTLNYKTQGSMFGYYGHVFQVVKR